ncbi:MAG: hypothetical protein IJS47_03435 [Clostridia bacterium]|nr:hypothetical protein [Clostridia bacterium]
MNTYALKIPRLFTGDNVITVVDKNNPVSVHRTLGSKDIVMVDSDHIREYEWYIVSVEDDEIIMVNGDKWHRFSCIDHGFKDTVRMNNAPELLGLIQRKGYKLPQKVEALLHTSLNELFSKPIFRTETREWSTASVFIRYKDALEELHKTVNDFVNQAKIDTLFDKLIVSLAIGDANLMYNTGRIMLSPIIREELKEATMQFKRIRSLAFDTADAAKGIHKWSSEWKTSVKFEGIDLVVRVHRDHVYVLIPHGKDGYIMECVGWFDFY